MWWGKEDGKKVSFEWSEGGTFAVPLNSTHRLYNGANEPVLFLGVTSAPPLMDLLPDRQPEWTELFWGILTMTSSIRPYSLASAADMNRSRSMSFSICSTVLPVCSANKRLS